jgi:hypothetical protein
MNATANGALRCAKQCAVPKTGRRGRRDEKLGYSADRCADDHGKRALFHATAKPRPMTEPKQPHDALFKKTFSVPEHAAAEFRAVLPPKLIACADFSTLALCPGSYVGFSAILRWLPMIGWPRL